MNLEPSSHLSFVYLGFNRYMVECEFLIENVIFPSTVVLIDTWWNVNASYPAHSAHDTLVLIDTWWNVNIDHYL